MKPLTPAPAIDALIGDEEQEGKKKRESKERYREPAANSKSKILYDLSGFLGKTRSVS